MKTTLLFTTRKLCLSLSIVLLSVFSVFAQTYTINTVAGNGSSGFSGDGGQATVAQIASPYGVYVDANGNIYIPDNLNNRVRIVNTNGVINTFAGTGVASFSGDGGQATAATLNSVVSVVGDASGNIYIADGGNNRIRMVKANGVITTIAGTGVAAYTGDGGPATAATLNFPCALALDGAHNLYISDLHNQAVRMINSNGIINTVAGNGTSGFSGDGGQATAAQVQNAFGITLDAIGNLYIADQFNNRVREVNTNGIINTIAGTGAANYTGDGGPATAATMNRPFDVATDAANNVYIADFANNVIRKVNNAGVITTIAGTGVAGFSGDGGNALLAQLHGPTGFSLDQLNNMYISDQSNDRIREMVLTCTMTASITSFTNDVCANGVTATATGAGNNGTAPYIYSWNTIPAQGNATATGLSAGTYKVIVTDQNGCTATAGVTITAPPVLTANISSLVNVNCCGMSDGSTTVTAGGGTGNYTYLWAPSGQTKASITGLSAGSYTITVNDANGCTTTANAIITQPPCLTNNANATNSPICAGACTNINSNASGGTGSYTYSWNVAGTNASVNVCPPNTTTYTSTVVDANGCSTTASVTVTVNALPNVTLSATSDTECIVVTSDMLNGNPAGGVYSGPGVAGNNFNPSTAGVGTHRVYYTFTNGNGCTNTDSVDIVVNNCTGVPLISELDNQLKFYPNPFSQNITINNMTNTTVSITMFNMLGENIGMWTLNKGDNVVNTESYPSGFYMIQIRTKNGIVNRKMIKVN